MAKKRKTRKQKERLQQRKTTKQVVDTQAKADTKKPQATTKDTSVDSAQDRGNKVVDEAHARRLRLMKYSLKVFAVLAVLQLVVWGLLQANLFPERILEILTG